MKTSKKREIKRAIASSCEAKRSLMTSCAVALRGRLLSNSLRNPVKEKEINDRLTLRWHAYVVRTGHAFSTTDEGEVVWTEGRLDVAGQRSLVHVANSSSGGLLKERKKEKYVSDNNNVRKENAYESFMTMRN